MANITKVYLMNCLLEKDYAHTMYFASESAQQAYFQKRKQSAMTFTDVSYQRKDHIIRIPKHIDTLYAAKVNYCMYQNEKYSNKWFYCFITDMKYINDEVTEVHIQTDCIQTWLFDFTVKHSFVEREHAVTDWIGDNTIDEGLELGEYICQTVKKDNDLTECQYVILVTESTTGDDKPLAVNMGGIFYAGGAYICNTMSEVINIVQVFNNAGKTEAITAVYMVPKKIINNTSGALQFSGQTEPVKYDITDIRPTHIGSTYKEGFPKNKKLFCFPYCYLLVSNNAGSSNIYKYERFSDQILKFKIYGAPVVGGSIKCVPQNYNGVADNQEEGLMCGKFPTLSWSADLFTNWVTQNSVNIALGVGAGAVQIVGGLATMAATYGAGAAIGGAGVVSGVSTIANTLAQVHQQSFTPNSAKGNTNGGDINTAAKANTFYFYKMSIKEEYARVIDEYFTMFGYKCNRVKVPAKNHRENFWYTKTIDANIVGGIPQDDLQTIKDCYNRGITFWKTEDNFRNYSVSNNTV
jgi:hypothetical protein